jgi:DNA-binding HxlR family transcriptional regulator
VAEPARRKRAESAPRPRGLAGVRGSAAGRAPALDGLIHHRLRLGIVSALAAAEALTFNELKALLQISDGNLSVHARKLEDAHYVTCTKTFADRRPRTEYRITPQGRRELHRYLDHMEALVHATRTTLER